MSSKLKLKATSGGSLSMLVDDTLTTDEEFNVSNSGILFGTGYIKYPDGTLICYGSVAQQTTDTQMGTSGIYRNSVLVTTTFAIAFTNAPTLSLAGATTVNQYCWVGPLGVITTTGFGLTIMSTGSTGQLSPHYHAIGRWK